MAISPFPPFWYEFSTLRVSSDSFFCCSCFFCAPYCPRVGCALSFICRRFHHILLAAVDHALEYYFNSLGCVLCSAVAPVPTYTSSALLLIFPSDFYETPFKDRRAHPPPVLWVDPVGFLGALTSIQSLLTLEEHVIVSFIRPENSLFYCPFWLSQKSASKVHFPFRLLALFPSSARPPTSPSPSHRFDDVSPPVPYRRVCPLELMLTPWWLKVSTFFGTAYPFNHFLYSRCESPFRPLKPFPVRVLVFYVPLRVTLVLLFRRSPSLLVGYSRARILISLNLGLIEVGVCRRWCLLRYFFSSFLGAHFLGAFDCFFFFL